MRLGIKTLEKLARGTTYLAKENGYIAFYRYSKAQIQYMAQPSYDYGWRNWAKFTGGIRLEFKTDSENISFDYIASCSHERANTVDLYIENKLHSVYKIEEKLKGSVHFSLPEGEKLVTIYFPNESILKIKGFTLDGGYKSVKDKRPKLLIIGDSITQGAGPEIASVSYVNILSREYKYNVLDQGIGGYRYEPCDLMLNEEFKPDRIMIALGTNYYDAVDTYDYKKAVCDFYERLNQLYPNTPKLVMTPLYRTRELDMERFMWCINTIKAECAKYDNIIVADGLSLMPNDPVSLSDGVHPSTYGSIMLANNLMKFMKENKF
ncbi:MAG: SGNH/GDSL hydrolase family protein [Clostridia bacterium]|nr:SGNH/GDSL hydrolase family protein [Clostridia bacterium]